MTDIVFIVAVAENGVIGRDNAMPWHLTSDLKRFRALTSGKPIIMGRKTYQSIGKALPKRTNIVVTRDQSFAAPGVIAVPSLDDAYDVARGDALRRGASGIMVIGGAEIFRQWEHRATRVEWTIVHASPEGDTVMAPLDPAAWDEVTRARHEPGEGDSSAFSYVTYRRRVAGPLRCSFTLTIFLSPLAASIQGACVVRSRSLPYKPSNHYPGGDRSPLRRD